ncbi:chloride channel [Amylostereum chailletii]|nr:chloride channel [Amylostereum chailletii]
MATSPPSGPLSGPSNTTWRRQRLLHIGSRTSILHEENESEHPTQDGMPPSDSSPLIPPSRPGLMPHHSTGNYGALYSPTSPAKPTFRARHGLPALPALRLPNRPASNPASPSPHRLSPSFDRASFFRLTSQRPISAYDAPYASKNLAELSAAHDAKTNGIRVWYSSFSSIDWLHDAIKDSARMYRLRRRKSLRGRTKNLLDRGMGWVIVTIVGFLTAVMAFLIVRSEQWLFDIKEGYCSTSWSTAKRFCCNTDDGALGTHTVNLFAGLAVQEERACDAWRTWGEVLAGDAASEVAQEWTEYATYAFFALLLAGASATLTIALTASTSFVTRKDSGVLSADFANEDDTSKVSAPPTDHPAKRKIMYYAAGSGIPEIKTILSGFVIHGYLGGRTLFTKSVGLALSVASGLSLGKEGPFVHIASCIGNIVSRYFAKYENNEGKRREILSAASAAGVAVAFGAPIGGVLFSLEEVSYFFPPKVMWRSFFCAMIAAITLRFLDPFGTGKLVLFQVTYDKDWHAYELVPFLLLGVFGGVYGAYFSKLNYRWSRDVRNKTWLKTHPIAEVLLVTLLTTVLCFLNPYTRMGGTELVAKLFAECRSGSANALSGLCVLDPPRQTWPVVRAIAIALVVKAALTVVTFGIRLPAGIFIPTLGVGACAGRIAGLAVQYAQWRYPSAPMFAVCNGDLTCVIPGLYAMVGAAAALSGVTRTTVSLAVIMFELTDTLTYAVPVMLAVLVAKTVADALEPKGIYDQAIELAQLPYLEAKHQYVFGNMEVRDATDRDVDVIRLDTLNTVRSLRDQLLDLVTLGDSDAGFPILRRDGARQRMVGFIGGNELEHALSIVAEDADHEVKFQGGKRFGAGMSNLSSSSISSIIEEGGEEDDPFNFRVYMDQAPLTVMTNSPLELVQQMFVKLGARYVVVTDSDGYYEGIIDKKGWLAFLSDLDHKSA